MWLSIHGGDFLMEQLLYAKFVLFVPMDVWMLRLNLLNKTVVLF